MSLIDSLTRVGRVRGGTNTATATTTATGQAGQTAIPLKSQHYQTPLSIGGIGSVTYPTGMNPELTLDPEAAAAAGMFRELGSQSASALGPLTGQTAATAGEFMGQAQGLLSQLGSFNPLADAQTRYERLQSVLAPDRARQRADTEARLLAQGRLDSSGGAIQMGEQERAIAAQDAQLLDQMYSEAEAARQSGVQQAIGLGQQGGILQGGLLGQATGLEQLRQGQYNPLFQLLDASQMVHMNEVNRKLGQGNMYMNYKAAKNAGGGGGGALGGIGGLIGGAAGLYFGMSPEAAMAGYQIGSGVGNAFGG